MIFFVLSLEEGFYAYQFKQMGWSVLNLMVIVTAGHGLILALWRVRIWFVYTVLCMCLRDLVDILVSSCQVGPSMHLLTPKATVLGYTIGGLVAFAFYFTAADQMLNHYWFNISPIKLGIEPFDYSAVHVDMSGSLWKVKQN